MGSIRPGPLPRPVCLLSRVPALPASGPSPDQGQQCLLDCPGLHHHQSQVPKKYPCHSIRVHGRTLTPSSAHSVVLRPESPSSGDAEPRTTLLAAAPMVFSADQCRDPDHCPPTCPQRQPVLWASPLSLADWPPPGWSRGVVFSSTSVLHPPGTLPLGKCPWTPQSRHQGLETSPHSSLTEERHPASPLPQGTPKGDGKGVGRGGHRPFRGNRDQDAGGMCERGRPAGEAGGLGQAGP